MDSLSGPDYLMRLFGVYGGLLTASERNSILMHLGYDLSLSEIAEQEGKTRAAVADGVKKGEKKLLKFEEKVGFCAFKSDLREAFVAISRVEDESTRLKLYEALGRSLG